MNIQIFGKSKCFDTKKAERYFKERKIKYQLINMTEKGMSKGEYNSLNCSKHLLSETADRRLSATNWRYGKHGNKASSNVFQ